MKTSRWLHICALEDIYPESGVCALIEGQQVAVFRINNGVHAIGNHDPVSGVNVLSRGIVGDIGGELVVASPLYKQHFSLITGRCLEEPEHAVPVYLARIHEGQVWVRAEAVVTQRAAGRRRLVVIGNDVAAMRTIEELLELTPQAYDITVFGAEQRGSEEITTHPPQWFRDQGIVMHLADPVVHIDRARRCVRSRLGVELGYDRLLIATGSVPVLLPVPGRELQGVLTFRDLQDVDGMLAGAHASRRAVVIGGGPLGLEAATGLLRRGMEVTVVHTRRHLMDQQLDAHAGELLRKDLEGQGLKFCLSARAVSIQGSVQVTGVQLADGREVPADLVVMATGVRPNTELAKAAGLRCERGILVDDTLQSFDPAIYAVGECVQHRDSTFGLVAPLWDQARVCAAYLAERGIRRYRGSQASTQFKVSGVKVYSAGDLQGGAASESLVLRDPRRGIYKRLFIEDNKVRGAVLYGDTGDGSWYFDLINEGRDVGSVRDTLLFGPTG